ncbi:hypothetical protein BPOR_0028g00280 [Botrytis porri]|uniref:Uncharacterized protein n=1 Tax=Botrytis porri TaxID=87229 RepID=A0A4Z1L3Y6_9HELO|nr:hypothetical protein BPOR_0028g00280 [Botrytis porri]
MKGFIRATLLVAVGAAGLAQGYRYEARGLSDIIAALEGGGKASAAPAVTKEITKTMTVTKSAQGAAAPTGAAIQAAGTGGQFSFLTSTVFASGAPPTVTVTPLPQMITQTVTEQLMVTMMATQMSVVTSMVTMTMMQTTTVMVSGATIASVTTSAAIQAGKSPAPALGAAQVAQPNPVDINTLALSSSLVLGNLAVATAV